MMDLVCHLLYPNRFYPGGLLYRQTLLVLNLAKLTSRLWHGEQLPTGSYMEVRSPYYGD
jgi:hypothetical protein